MHLFYQKELDIQSVFDLFSGHNTLHEIDVVKCYSLILFSANNSDYQIVLDNQYYSSVK